MPANTSKIDRSTRWGNPFRVGSLAVHPVTGKRLRVATREQAIAMFDLYVSSKNGADLAAAARRELRGKNLACWCKAGQSCHGDILLEIANGLSRGRRAA
jgi:hypothetical protein